MKSGIAANKNTAVPRRATGFSLVELVVVLAVIALVIGGVIKGYKDQRAKAEAAVNGDTVISIIAGMQQYFGQPNKFADASTQNAISANVIPATLTNPDGVSANNTYGGAITVQPGTISVAGDAADIGYANVPSAHCYGLVVRAEESATVVRVGNATVKGATGGLDAGALADACKASERVALVFTVGRNG